MAASLVVAACGGAGAAEPTEPTIPADAASIVAASATAMGGDRERAFRTPARRRARVHRPGRAVGAEQRRRPVHRAGRRPRPCSRSRSTVDSSASSAPSRSTTRSGCRTRSRANSSRLPAGIDLDPSLFFDPRGGWQPLMEGLTDVELVGIGGARRRRPLPHRGHRAGRSGRGRSPPVSSGTRTSTSTSGSSR